VIKYYIHTATRNIQSETQVYLLQLGITTIHSPALLIEPTKAVPPKHNDYDYIVVSSVAAANYFKEYASQVTTKQYFCIGSATTTRLKQIVGSHSIVVANPPYGSEMLLRKVPTQLANKRILIVCGQQPRQYLMQQLTEYGAVVETHCNYRRLANPYFLQYNLSSSEQLVSIYSAFSLAAFKQLQLQLGVKLNRQYVIAMGGRVVNYALANGAKNTVAIPYLSDKNIAKILRDLMQTK